jgi:hypothetical protein
MSKHLSICAIFILGFTLLLTVGTVMAQLGNSGSIEGVVKDASGGVIAGAKIDVSNPVSGFSREITSDSDGNFRITNVPFNPYHLTVTAEGFSSFTQDVDVRSTVPTTLSVILTVGESATSITVEASSTSSKPPPQMGHQSRSSIDRDSDPFCPDYAGSTVAPTWPASKRCRTAGRRRWTDW